MKNIFEMNSSALFPRFAMLVLAGVLASCSATTPENDKQQRLEKLKTQQVSLTKEIGRLEAEIAKANPEAAMVKAKEIAFMELTPRTFNHYVQTQGAVEAEDNILVSAQTMGVVTQVFVTEGQVVKKGQLLAQIDNSVILRSVESMKAQLELAKSVFDRQQNLWDQKIGTEVQYLQAKTNKESLEEQVASLQAQIEMTKIKSPIYGTIDEVFAKIGQNLAPGFPAVRVINTSDLKIKANVSESYITAIRTGNKVMVTVDDLDKSFDARVTFVGKNIDLLSRTFPVEVKLPDMPNLRPNMTAVVKIVFHSDDAALAVPVNVVQEINNEKIVYVVVQEGDKTVARRKVVEVDGVYDNIAQITKGLSAGDKIITVGYQSLNDGELVKI